MVVSEGCSLWASATRLAEYKSAVKSKSEIMNAFMTVDTSVGGRSCAAQIADGEEEEDLRMWKM
tara:strand:+ start:971 stop:1162 length:192 start_codon:yes stop_codon:yes gene_type:complete